MKSGALTLLVVLCAFIPVALPVFLVVDNGIWAAVAINQETFGVHFTAYPTLALGYHFIGNAMAFAAVYAYLPSFLVHQVLPLSEFDRFQVWWLGVFAIHATLLVGLAVWIARQPLTALSKVCIVLVGGTLASYAAAGYANILTPNYHLLEVVLYVLASALLVLTMQGKLRAGPRTAIVVGVAAALAFWTKFTLIVTVGTFFGLVLLLGGRWCLWRRLAISAAAFVAATAVLAAVYFVGHPSYVVQFARDLPGMYSSDFLTQRFEPLVAELMAWDATVSSFQNIVRLVLLATVGGAIWTAFHPRPQRWAFLACSLLVIAFFARFLVERAAPNTFADAMLFGSFIVSVWLADWASSRWWSAATVGMLALYLAFIGFITWWPLQGGQFFVYVAGIRLESEQARAIDDDINARPELPIVYYWFGQPAALFPSTYFYSLFSGNQDTKQVYFQRYSPRTSLRQPAQGVQRGPHVMVIPLRILPGYDPSAPLREGDTPLFDLYPSFGRVVSDPAQQCVRHPLGMPAGGPGTDTLKAVIVCTVTGDVVERYDERDLPPPDGLVNLALGKQMRVGGPVQLPPELAVDGRTSEEGGVTTVASIGNSWQPWIEVDLGAPLDVSSVQLWGRTNPCCADRLRDIYVLASTEPFPAVDARLLRDAPGVVSHYVDGVVHTPTRVPIGEPVRYVRVQAADGNFLEMTELQVWGRDAAR